MLVVGQSQILSSWSPLGVAHIPPYLFPSNFPSFLSSLVSPGLLRDCDMLRFDVLRFDVQPLVILTYLALSRSWRSPFPVGWELNVGIVFFGCVLQCCCAVVCVCGGSGSSLGLSRQRQLYQDKASAELN